MVKADYNNKLKKWRKNHAEEYAKAIISQPKTTTIPRLVPTPGVILIMGSRRKGKTACAHKIAEEMQKRHNMPAVLHLPNSNDKMRRKLSKLMPKWMRVVRSQSEWDKKSVVIYDEASQSAHARRTQSGNSVELDNLIGISGQRKQLIIFISHHSRKLDPNVIHEVNQIHWKMPSYAHQLFERDELEDFSMKAFDFFKEIRKSKPWRECSNTTQRRVLESTVAVDMDDLCFFSYKSKLPTYWSDELSRLFQDISSTKSPDGAYNGIPGFK